MKAGIVGVLAIGAFAVLPAVAAAQAPPPPPPGGGYGGGGGGAAPAATGAAVQGVVAKGVKLAINSAGLGGDDVEFIDDEQGRRLGFGVGGYIVYAMNPQLSVQIELLYLQKGSTFDAGDTVWKLDYLELPVLGRFDIGQPGPGMRPYLVGGVGIGMNIGAEEDDDGDVESIECVAGTEFSLQAGAGTTIPSGAAAIAVEVRYSMGLSSIADTSSDECGGEGESVDVDIKNNVLSAFVGYQF